MRGTRTSRGSHGPRSAEEDMREWTLRASQPVYAALLSTPNRVNAHRCELCGVAVRSEPQLPAVASAVAAAVPSGRPPGIAIRAAAVSGGPAEEAQNQRDQHPDGPEVGEMAGTDDGDRPDQDADRHHAAVRTDPAEGTVRTLD